MYIYFWLVILLKIKPTWYLDNRLYKCQSTQRQVPVIAAQRDLIYKI